MDQQALLAGLGQLNAGLANNLVLVEYLPGAPQGTIQHHAHHAIASPPSFSMPGLTLQSFSGTPAHTASLLPNAPLPPLLGLNQAASQPPTLVRPECAGASCSSKLAAARCDGDVSLLRFCECSAHLLLSRRENSDLRRELLGMVTRVQLRSLLLHEDPRGPG